MTDDSPDPPTERDETDADIRDCLETVLTDDGSSRRLDHLHRIANQFTEQSTETAAYDHAIAGAYDLFDIRYAVVAIRRGDRWVTVASTRSDPDVRFGQVPIVNAEIETALDRNETALIEDVSEATGDAVPFENGRALCSPIGDAGMLQLVRDEGGFDETDVHYAKLLGWITATHLEQLTLHDEIESIEAQLASFVDFEEEVFERASHDLRTPLTTIIGYMELLAEEEVGSLSDEQRRFARLVLRKATELDATIETLTSSFDTRLANARAGRPSLPATSRVDETDPDDGPFVFLSLDTEMGTLLAKQLTDLGYEVTVADDPETAREAVRRSPSSTIVVELFATSTGSEAESQHGTRAGDGTSDGETAEGRHENGGEENENGGEDGEENENGGEDGEENENGGEDGEENEYENGVTLAEAIRREEGNEETTIRVTSIFRDDAIGITQLGASAYVPERADSIGEAVELLLGVSDEERLYALAFDATAAENSIGELPANWEVTTVDDVDAARTASQTALYDLAIVRTDTLTGRERGIVRTLRERRHGRKLPVVLVDSGPTVTDARYVLGGKLFVQRPITVADLTSMLVSAPTAGEDGGGSTDRRDHGGSIDP